MKLKLSSPMVFCAGVASGVVPFIFGFFYRHDYSGVALMLWSIAILLMWMMILLMYINQDEL